MLRKPGCVSSLVPGLWVRWLVHLWYQLMLSHRFLEETTVPFGYEQLSDFSAEIFQWEWALACDCIVCCCKMWEWYCKLYFESGSSIQYLSKEAAVLAKWLKGVTLAVAQANPQDEHAAPLGIENSVIFLSLRSVKLNLGVCDAILGCGHLCLWI